MTTDILSHLKNRLRQRTLRQQVTRSKVLTPILDSINAAAKAEGISADEIVADYVSGKFEHPVVSAALGKAPGTPKAPAPARPPVAIVKAPAKPSAKAPAPAIRFASASDALVMQAVIHCSSSDADKLEALAELKKRGITQLPKGGFTKSHV